MKILVAIDGSDNSYEAVRALKYVRKADQLIILHAIDVPRPVYPMMMPEVADELYRMTERSMRDDAERLVGRVKSLLPPHTGQVVTRMEVGSPAETIVEMAKQERVDLIVMGARGIGPIKERLLGSIAHRVLTYASCAKLIVSTPLRAFSRLLLAIAGKADADHALGFLTLNPFASPVEIRVLTVLPHTIAPWPAGSVAFELEATALRNAREFVDGVVGRLRSLGYQATGDAVLGSPVQSIIEQHQKTHSDVIMMGSHGSKGLTRLILGSVSHAVLHHNPCPLLVFNEEAERYERSN
jgi:nucleotide-binding universal stress UspA family protein